MSQRIHPSSIKYSAGEAAVEGLLRGMAAGAVMLGFLLAAGMLPGLSQAQAAQAAAREWVLWPLDGLTLIGLFGHLAVASFYGLLWGPAWRWSRRYVSLPGWMLGMAYGIILFMLAQSLAQALPSPLQRLDSSTMLAAHACYGWVLGALSR